MTLGSYGDCFAAYPENDGGASVTSYEVRVVNRSTSRRDRLNGHGDSALSSEPDSSIAYKGTELACTVNSLQPGRVYSFELRAVNKIGTSVWSDTIEVMSGADAPEMPAPPTVTAKSSNCLLISWTEPASNGAPITEYHLEWSPKQETESFSQVSRIILPPSQRDLDPIS